MIRFHAVALGLAALGVAQSAGAGAPGPLSGSWQLELRCKGVAGGQAEKATFSWFLPIDHEAATGLLQAGAGDTGALEGLVVFDAQKPDRFRLSLASCALGSPQRGLALHATGKLDGAAGKGKGSAIVLDVMEGRVASCKAKLERTDANLAPVLTCP